MHNALSYQRAHQPKGSTIATYHPETNMAYADNPKGPLFAKLGHVRSARDDPLMDDEMRGQRMWLLPEEVLFLLERGSVDLRWPADEESDEEEGLPMSVQAAYAMFIGDPSTDEAALTFERLAVYSNLKRAGYIVLRAPSWDGGGSPLERQCYAPLPQRPWQPGLLNFATLWKALFTERNLEDTTRKMEGPLVRPDLYRSYAEIYRRLAIVNYYDPTTHYPPSEPEDPSTDSSFRIAYHVWKPGSTTFKKRSPGTPDFRVAVVNARETAVPTLDQLGSLTDTVLYDPPAESAQLNQKLKHGYKNVILAVVDQGVVSYLRIADAAFGKQKLYERTGRGPGGKRGGRGGRGGGRGRGRR